jgi:hypothetical protein
MYRMPSIALLLLVTTAAGGNAQTPPSASAVAIEHGAVLRSLRDSQSRHGSDGR